jgi:D-amino-acid oxidase
MTNNNIAIIGCGVSGLASGLRLLEQGFAVTIFARDLPPHTTSNVAGAFWAPGSLFSSGQIRAWSRASYLAFQQLAANPESGVTLKTLVELFDEPVDDLPQLDLIDDLRPIDIAQFPASYQGGYQLTVPAIDTPVYMPFLVRQFQEQGGTIKEAAISRLAELAGDYRLVINCAGVWARQLVPDPLVYPIRGQVIRVHKPAGLKPEILHGMAGGEVTYIVPRSGDCLLGGTYEDNNWSLEPDMATAQAILNRCAELDPAFREAEIIEHKVGLRPGRPTVCFELERAGNKSGVIHNYGHGSIGHTLSWGCAAEVARLALEFFSGAGFAHPLSP